MEIEHVHDGMGGTNWMFQYKCLSCKGFFLFTRLDDKLDSQSGDPLYCPLCGAKNGG